MSILDAMQCQPSEVQNQNRPGDGSKCVPIPLNFGSDPTVVSPVTFDYSNQQRLGKFSILQGFYIDNADNGSALTVLVAGTNFRVICPANSQGFFSVLCRNPIQLTFSTAGAVNVLVYMLNFPVATAVWKP